VDELSGKLWLTVFCLVCFQDIDITGMFVVSCGMDHSLKIWSLQKPCIANAIEQSFDYAPTSHTDKFVSASRCRLSGNLKSFVSCNVPKLPVKYPKTYLRKSGEKILPNIGFQLNFTNFEILK